MDKRVIIVAGVLVVAVAVVLVVRSQRTAPPEPEIDKKPFPELQAERPKGDPKWVHPVIKKVNRIEVGKGDKTLVIRRVKAGDGRRDFGKWRIVKPFEYRADDYAVRQVLQRATNLRYWEPATRKKSEHAKLGVTDATGLRVKLFEDQRKIADFYIGKEVRTKLADRPVTYAYFRAAHQDTVWKVLGSLRLITKKELDEWRDPKILKLKRDEVVGIELKAGDAHIALARDPKIKDPKKRGKSWTVKASQPEVTELEQSDVTRMASTLSYLRAKEFVDDAKPVETGLQSPTHQLTVKLQGGKSHTLLFGKTVERKVKRGKKERTEKLTYVQIKGNPQVFLVQERRLKVLKKRPTDLRDRSVIRLSARQQVNRLEVHKKGDTLLFARTDGKWTVKKPAGMEFEAKAMERAFKTLRGRFKAKAFSDVTDPAKTGLDKPEGKLVLTVGPKPEKKKPANKKGDKKADKKAGKKADEKAEKEKAEKEKAAAPRPAPRPAARPAAPVRTETIVLLIGKEAAKRERYVQVQGRPAVYVIRQYTLKRLWKGQGKWKAARRPPGRMRGRMPGRMRGRMPGRMPGRMRRGR